MARPSIDQIRSIGNVTQLFRWNLQIAAFPSAITAPPTTEALNLRCESVELPKLTNQPVEVNIRGHKVKQPGIGQYAGTLQMTFIETVDNVVHNFLRQWREACWQTKTGISRPKTELEAIILIHRLNQQDEPIWEYKLIGAFLEDYDAGGTLDGTSTESLRPVFTLSYDYFEDQAL